MPVDFWHLKRYITSITQQGIRPERRNNMKKTFTRTMDHAVISLNSQARAYFAGQYDCAYYYYYGGENTIDLARQAVC